jgi:DNA/RNA-binding protein KIN17
MPKAEFGSTKHVANQMKSKGLQVRIYYSLEDVTNTLTTSAQRLRWYCQACEKQCRDANGFKCHVQSEKHVRQVETIGEDPRKYIQGFSNDFQRDFISLLRTAHNEKFISANKFYNEYIRDKEHVHMNATKWASLTEFVKHLGREGIVNVKEDEKDGLCIAWRDTSVQALRRREEIREQELAEAKNGAGEEKMLKRMAKRAKEEAEAKQKIIEARQAELKSLPSPPSEEKGSESPSNEEVANEDREAPKPEAAPVKISFGMKIKTAPVNKTGLGIMKNQSIFKRARETEDGKPKKKVKL